VFVYHSLVDFLVPTTSLRRNMKSVKMDTKIIDVIFQFGSILLITPRSVRSNRKLTYFQKLCGFLTFILLTSCINFYFFGIRLVGKKPPTTQYILLILMIITYFIHDFNILIIVKLHKHAQWFQLMKYLECTQCHKNKFKQYYLQFVISQVTGFVVALIGNCIYLFLFNVIHMIGILIICTEIYMQLFYLVLRCIILNMLLSRYQYQNQLLLKPISKEAQIRHLLKVLMDVQDNLLILKKAADVFNDIFGWTTLLNIFATSIRTLIILDIFVRREGPFQLLRDTRSLLSISYQITLLLIAWV
jgi:hypothetical protein